jgi:hypothetical protein
MTQAEWDSCTDPNVMLDFLRASGRASERKVRLLAVAGCRCLWPLLSANNARKALSVVERYADGQVSRKELLDARSRAWGAATSFMETLTRSSSTVTGDASQTHLALVAAAQTTNPWPGALFDLTLPAVQDALRADAGVLANLVRDIFRPLASHQLSIDSSLLTWNGGIIAQLAQAAYEERSLPEGHLDKGRLAVLADALEEASSADTEVLAHLRARGAHVRGCFAVDTVLGRG